jgi:DNA-binding NarL/FixJ family response regulator
MHSSGLSDASDTSDSSDSNTALCWLISWFSAQFGAGTTIAVHAAMQSTAATVFELPTSVAVATLRWRRMTDGSALWGGLVEGAWSVVAEFECDACLYLVVRGNGAEARAARALSEREREVLGRVVLGQANKLVSYELGMSQSGVSICIKEACSKLGIGARTPLLQLMQFGTRPPQPGTEGFCVEAGESAVLRIERQEVVTPDALTSSERAIFLAMLRGLSNAEIAARRNRSLRTVANQVAALFGKLGVSSRAELVARHGSLAGVFLQQTEPTPKLPVAVRATDFSSPRSNALPTASTATRSSAVHSCL